MKTYTVIATPFRVLFALAIACHAFAGVTGDFEGVSLSITNGGKYMEPDGGSGTLKNEKGTVVAHGALERVDMAMAIRATKGATFVHAPCRAALSEASFSSGAVTEFAAVELGAGNEWTIKDNKFVFVLEIPSLNQPRIAIALDKSLARASAIKLPKGVHTLWGYTVTVENTTGTVKYAHGRIVNASGATYRKSGAAAPNSLDSAARDARSQVDTGRIASHNPFGAAGSQFSLKIDGVAFKLDTQPDNNYRLYGSFDDLLRNGFMKKDDEGFMGFLDVTGKRLRVTSIRKEDGYCHVQTLEWLPDPR